MKNLVYKIICISFLVLQSCNTQEEVTIFVDPCLSTTIDKENLTKYFRQNLAEYLRDYDPTIIDLKLIFENTASIANSRLIKYTPPEYGEPAFLYKNKSDQTKIELYKGQIQQNRQLFVDKLVSKVTSLECGTGKSGIAEMIVPLSKVEHSFKAFFISDLIQDSPLVNLRDIKIIKESEVIALARKHALVIRNKYIIPETVMYNVELICLIVTNEDGNSLYPFLEMYWKTYFKSFGVDIKFQRL